MLILWSSRWWPPPWVVCWSTCDDDLPAPAQNFCSRFFQSNPFCGKMALGVRNLSVESQLQTLLMKFRFRRKPIGGRSRLCLGPDFLCFFGDNSLLRPRISPGQVVIYSPDRCASHAYCGLSYLLSTDGAFAMRSFPSLWCSFASKSAKNVITRSLVGRFLSNLAQSVALDVLFKSVFTVLSSA